MKNKILYIDDEQENLDSFQIAFMLQYEIFTAVYTQKAEEILEKEKIKVVVCDQKMDKESGLDFIKRVKPLFPDVVFTLLTGYTDLSLVLESLNTGNVYRFMAKPMERDEIIQTIENAIEKYDLEQSQKVLVEEIKSKNKELESTLAQLVEANDKVYKTMVAAEEKERERYAKELHDGLGPVLTTCMIYLHTLLDEKDSQAQQDYINKAINLVKNASESIREISNNLSPDILRRYGLVDAVKSFIERLKPVTKIQFVIDSNIEGRFPEVIEFTVYRTIIELINNSVKYAQASKICLAFNYNIDCLNIVFFDNGDGFEYDEAIRHANGFGLTNLENRIQKMGGEYNFQTSPGQGTKVKITVQAKQV